jgi:hypothetical protein
MHAPTAGANHGHTCRRVFTNSDYSRRFDARYLGPGRLGAGRAFTALRRFRCVTVMDAKDRTDRLRHSNTDGKEHPHEQAKQSRGKHPKVHT